MNNFILGILFGVNMIGLIEDIQYLTYGKEKYFMKYEETFMLPHKTMPLHIVVTVVIIYLILSKLFAKLNS